MNKWTKLPLGLCFTLLGSASMADQPSLRSLAPSLSDKIGFNNPSYATQLDSAPAGDPSSGAESARFTAPDGKAVTVNIPSPKVEGKYEVPPIQSGEDPAAYFYKALSQAGTHKTVVFPQGATYNFSAAECQKGGAHLKLNSPTDVVIDGNGSVLNFAAPCAGIALVGATRVVLKNFTIDWPTLQIASLGTIVSSGGSGPRRYTYDVQVDPKFVSEKMPQSYKSINSWDAEHDYWSVRYPDHEVGYNPRQPLSAAGEAHGVNSWGARFAPGEHVIIRHYTTEGDAIDLYHAQDVSFQNITIYSSPGFGIAVLQGSSGFAISNCKITRAPDRPISTAADALHIDNYVGNVLVENNTFAYQGDDGLNLNTTTFRITNAGPNETAVPSNHGYLRQGDPVVLFTSNMRLDNSSSWHITAITPNPSDHTNHLTLDHPIPAGDRNGYLVDLNFSGARYVVRNNRFLHNRARGALLQTAYGLVEGNTFTGQTLYALFLTVFPPEGPGAQNVTILDNKISATGVNGGPAAVILSRERMIYSDPAQNPPVHQNILFAGNVVSDVPGPAFYISSANNVVLYNNTLRNTNMQHLENNWNAAGSLDSAIVVNDASNVILRNNSIEGTKKAVSVDPKTTSGVSIAAN
ncbi:MAG TPA: right-handed parallel beta-helix repeat-containing protein [Steroidobacteraceae bacterium]|jgi:hypothetical protein|nr:right-handed parallel beta-helix repeat-containing protein [Steroidobacteraceae bacterium]